MHHDADHAPSGDAARYTRSVKAQPGSIAYSPLCEMGRTVLDMPSWLPGVCALTAARSEMRAKAREQAREGVLPQTAPAGRALRRRGLFGGAR
jgi:hypothetical protein